MPDPKQRSRPLRSRLLLLAALVLTALAVAGFLWQRQDQAQRRAIAHAAVPQQPALEGWPREFVHQIEAAESRIRSGEAPARSLARLAQLYHANGFHNEALQAYEGLLALEPDNPRWLHLAALILAGQGHSGDAIPLLQELLRREPDYRAARLLLADARFKTGDSERARGAYEPVLENHPDNAHALLGLTRIALAQGQPEDAMVLARRLTGAQPDFTPGWALLATLEDQAGNEESARIARRHASKGTPYTDPPDPWKDALVEDCYDSYLLAVASASPSFADDPAAAARLLRRAIRLAPEDATAHRLLAQLEQRRGRFEVARQHLKRSTELAPGEADGWVFLVRLFAEMHAPAERAQALRRALEHCPDSMSLHLEHGEDLVAAGNLDDALEAFKRARQLRPEEAMPLIQIARIQLHQGKLADGLEAMQAVLRIEPDHPLALSTLALHAIESNHDTRARELLLRARRHARMPEEDLSALSRQFEERFGQAPWSG